MPTSVQLESWDLCIPQPQQSRVELPDRLGPHVPSPFLANVPCLLHEPRLGTAGHPLIQQVSYYLRKLRLSPSIGGQTYQHMPLRWEL